MSVSLLESTKVSRVKLNDCSSWENPFCPEYSKKRHIQTAFLGRTWGWQRVLKTTWPTYPAMQLDLNSQPLGMVSPNMYFDGLIFYKQVIFSSSFSHLPGIMSPTWVGLSTKGSNSSIGISWSSEAQVPISRSSTSLAFTVLPVSSFSGGAPIQAIRGIHWSHWLMAPQLWQLSNGKSLTNKGKTKKI